MNGKLGVLLCVVAFSACYNPYPDNPITGGAGAGAAGAGPVGAGPLGAGPAGGAGGATGGGGASDFCTRNRGVLLCADFDDGNAVAFGGADITAPEDQYVLELADTGPDGSPPSALHLALLEPEGGGSPGLVNAQLKKSFAGWLTEFHVELDVKTASTRAFAHVVREGEAMGGGAPVSETCFITVRIDADEVIATFGINGGPSTAVRTERALGVDGDWANVGVNVDLAPAPPTVEALWKGNGYPTVIDDPTALMNWRNTCGTPGDDPSFRFQLGLSAATGPADYWFDDVIFDDKIP